MPGREDFFFRTVHLGTACWAFVALQRMAGALQLAQAGAWHVAAARATQVWPALGSWLLFVAIKARGAHSATTNQDPSQAKATNSGNRLAPLQAARILGYLGDHVMVRAPAAF